ncbi:MAG: hypothetical protein KF886_24415 [Candidatus Hydrogenedentes bacterium]|nr:hypothetical protein [Candidatus Hydrogenedentota bacterium]
MNSAHALLVANAGATLALAGLIWTVQLVHYPAFRFVPPDQFTAFEAFHQRQISLVVVPLMLVELATSAALIVHRPAPLPAASAVAGLVLVLAIWACTFAVQVPLHNRLAQGFDRDAIDRLVSTNAWRTAAWTLRAALVLWACYAAARAPEPPA